MSKFITEHAPAITLWASALCTFAVYSILYKENKFYRFFEHVFLGLATGYSFYLTWSLVMKPRWWDVMVGKGVWAWAFAAVFGSMFYFMYSKKHAWISKLIFGLFICLSAGGIFREFYEIYFPQLGATMRPLATNEVIAEGPWATTVYVAGVLLFYVILFSVISYFFFSFEQKGKLIKASSSLGRTFLMIGFGAIFGATVMGRMTLFIGRFNFLVNNWAPQVAADWHWFKYVLPILVIAAVAGIILALKKKPVETEEPPTE